MIYLSEFFRHFWDVGKLDPNKAPILKACHSHIWFISLLNVGLYVDISSYLGNIFLEFLVAFL